MRAFIAQRKSSGWVCRRKTYRDIGHSAGTLKRPALSRLRADLRAGKVDCVVVYSFDRLTRSLADQATLVAECCASGAMLVGVCPAFLYVRGMEATLCLSNEGEPGARPSSNRQPKGAKR